MSEGLSVPVEASEQEKYAYVLRTAKSLLTVQEPLVSNLANITAVLKEVFPKISWVGFYLFNGTYLYLGPFQGKLACTQIAIGKGVCGTVAAQKETIVVQNVHEFPGHIACDSGSNAEIVVPFIKDGQLLGVLDLDSYHFSAFSQTDKIYLEELLAFIASEIVVKTDPLVAGLFNSHV